MKYDRKVAMGLSFLAAFILVGLLGFLLLPQGRPKIVQPTIPEEQKHHSIYVISYSRLPEVYTLIPDRDAYGLSYSIDGQAYSITLKNKAAAEDFLTYLASLGSVGGDTREEVLPGEVAN